MSHQVVFYATPKDLRAMEERIRGIGPMVVLHTRAPSPTPRVLPSLEHEEQGAPWLFFLLARPEDLGSLRVTHVPAQGYWSVDVTRSPVVQLTRCFYDGAILRQGRAYHVDGAYEGETWVEKDAGFRTWAKAVLSAVKRTMKYEKDHWIAPDAAAWVASGGKIVR